MYAILEACGRQFKVSQGDTIRLDPIHATAGSKIRFNKILMVGGENAVVGAPYLPDVRIEGEIVAHGKAPKIVVFKFKRRQNYRRKAGHRQPFTEVKITEISTNL